MTILFLESFDGYSTIPELAGAAANAVGFKWQEQINVPGSAWGYDAGGENGQQLKRLAFGSSAQLTHALPAQASQFAFGLKWSSPLPVSATKMAIAGLDNSGSGANLWVGHSPTNASVELIIGTGGTQRAISSGLNLQANTRYAIEVKAVFVSGSTWTVTAKVNGVAVIGPSNLLLTNPNWGYFYLGIPIGLGIGEEIGALYESIYVDDTDFSPGAGAWKVRIARPSGAGAHTDWIPSSGANYAAINEQNVDDTSYVQGTNDGDEDTYAYDDIAFTSGYAVRAVQVCTRGAYTAGTKHLAHMARLATVEEQGASIALSASLAHNATVMPLDPNGAAWTPTTFNAAEFGQKQLA